MLPVVSRHRDDLRRMRERGEAGGGQAVGRLRGHRIPLGSVGDDRRRRGPDDGRRDQGPDHHAGASDWLTADAWPLGDIRPSRVAPELRASSGPRASPQRLALRIAAATASGRCQAGLISLVGGCVPPHSGIRERLRHTAPFQSGMSRARCFRESSSVRREFAAGNPRPSPGRPHHGGLPGRGPACAVHPDAQSDRNSEALRWL